MPEHQVGIRTGLQGKIFLNPQMADRMTRRAVGKEEAADQSPLSILSDRDLEVFR